MSMHQEVDPDAEPEVYTLERVSGILREIAPILVKTKATTDYTYGELQAIAQVIVNQQIAFVAQGKQLKEVANKLELVETRLQVQESYIKELRGTKNEQ